MLVCGQCHGKRPRKLSAKALAALSNEEVGSGESSPAEIENGKVLIKARLKRESKAAKRDFLEPVLVFSSFAPLISWILVYEIQQAHISLAQFVGLTSAVHFNGVGISKASEGLR